MIFPLKFSRSLRRGLKSAALKARHFGKWFLIFIAVFYFIFSTFPLEGVLNQLFGYNARVAHASPGTKTKTIEFFVGADSTGVNGIAANTDKNYVFTIDLPDAISDANMIKSAWAEYTFNMAVTTAPGVVTVGLTPSGMSETVFTSASYLTSGENYSIRVRPDFTAAVAAKLQAAGSASFTLRTRVAGAAHKMDMVKFFVTYAYDDTATTQIQTVKYRIGQSTGNTAINTDLVLTSPTMTIAENSPVIVSAWAEITGHVPATGTTDNTFTVKYDTDATTSYYLDNVGSTDTQPIYILHPKNTITLNASHSLTIRATAGYQMNLVGAEQVITYKFNYTNSTTLTTTNEYTLGSEGARASATPLEVTDTINLPENSITIRNVYLKGTAHAAVGGSMGLAAQKGASIPTPSTTFTYTASTEVQNNFWILSDDINDLGTITQGDNQISATFTGTMSSRSIRMNITYTFAKTSTTTVGQTKWWVEQQTAYGTTGTPQVTVTIDGNIDPASFRSVVEANSINGVTSDRAVQLSTSPTGTTDYNWNSTGEYQWLMFYHKNIANEVTGSGTYTVNLNATGNNVMAAMLAITWNYVTPPAQTVTIGATAGSKVANLDSGATSQYANSVSCSGPASCSAFTLSINSGSETVNSIGITVPAGQTATTNLSNLALFYDTDGNYSNGVTGQYGSTVASLAANGSATTINGSLAISSGTTYYFYVRFDLINGANNPAGGETVNFQIAANNDIGTVGSPTKTGAPKSLAGTTTIRPNVTSYTNTSEGALADGARNGQNITINGSGFGTACGSLTAQVATLTITCNSANKTTISATIPSAQTTTFGGTGSSGLLVTVGGTADDARQTFYIYPDIISIDTPILADAARELESITLNGKRFDTNANQGTVDFTGGFGTVSASITSWSDTAVTVTVPAAIADNIYLGDVRLTRNAATGSKTDLAYGANGFRILPKISSTSPVNLKGGRGDTISITGDHLCQSGTCPTSFSAANKVSFQGGEVTSGSSTWTDTSIPSVIIPATAADGNLNITSNTAYVSNNLTYDVKFKPIVSDTGRTPSNTASGQSQNLTLTGSTFSDSNDSPADTFIDSEWQVDQEGTFVTPEWTDTKTNVTSVTVNTTDGTFAGLLSGQTQLACGTTYSWRFRYKDNAGVASQEWSDWSNTWTFSTGSCGPDATSFSNSTEGGLADGGRIGHTIVISGSNFGTVNPGSRATCAGGAGTGCVKIGGTGGQIVADVRVTAWSDASITIQMSLTDLTTTYGGATSNGLVVYAAGISDPTPLTFYVYPDITSLTAPLGSNDGAREYNAADSDGIITINGNKFGTAPTGGSVVIVGGTVATFVADGTCDAGDGWAETCIKIQVPVSIADNIDSGYAIVTQGTGSNNKATNSTDAQGAINIWPRITGFTNTSDGTLTDGGRQAHVITVSGNHFGASAGTVAINTQTQDGSPTWGNSSITGAGIPNNGNDTGNIVVTRSDAKTSNNYGTFYIYPTITSLTVPTATPDAAREYEASDSDGVITINGNHFGAAGTITIIGSTGTQQTTATCSGSAYQATCVGVQIPTAISDSVYTGNIVINRTSDSKTHTYAGFRVLPRIISIVPSSGQPGTSVTISGDHFCQSGACLTAAQWNSTPNDGDDVKWATTNATVTGTPSHTSISANAPSLSDGGYSVTVTSNSYQSNGKNFTITNNVLTVSVSGTQTTNIVRGTNNNYVGGSFTFITNVASATISSIKISEAGTITANNNLNNVKLYYDTDGTYSGGEPQLGSTQSTFSASEDATFGGLNLNISTTTATYVYVVMDIGSNPTSGQTIEIQVTNPSTDVSVSGATNTDSSAKAIAGTTTVANPNLSVTVTGSQTANMGRGSSSQYVGGAFVLTMASANGTLTSFAIAENGNVNANSNLNNVKLYYDTDGTYSGGEPQLGSTGSFNVSEKATFSSLSLGLSTSATYIYVVLDVNTNASAGQTVEIRIEASGDVVGTGFNVTGSFPLDIAGTTTIQNPSLSVSTSGSQAANLDSGAANQHIGGGSTAGFRLQISGASATVTSVKISDTGTITFANLANPRLYYENVSSCAYNGNESNVSGSYSGEAVTFSMPSVSINASPNYTCLYFVFDIASSTAGGQTITVQITNPSTDVSVSGAENTDSSAKNFGSSTTLRPNVTGFSNLTDGTLSDGGRETHSIQINGAGFGTSCNIGGGNKVSVGAYDLSCTGATFSNTTITIPIDAAIPDNNNGGTGASGLLVTIGSAADDSRQTFYVYPTITSLTVPTATPDAAREYSASDSDGLITVNGNHFGSASSTNPLTILGINTSGYSAWDANSVTSAQIPTAITDNSYTGSIVLTRSDGKSHTYPGFRILPRITSLNPASGAENDALTVIGNHLCQEGAASCPNAFSYSSPVYKVVFGATNAYNPASWNWTNGNSSTSGIDVKVPAGSGIVAIKVTSADYESNTSNFSYLSTAPGDPANLQQFKSDDVTEISVGDGTNGTTLIFKGSVTASTSITIKLEIEIKSINTAFNGTITASSSPYTGVGPQTLSVTASGLADNTSFHWRARAKNVNTSETSNWVAFGNNPSGDGSGDGSPANTDFYIDASGPVISGVTATDISDIQGTILWSTNESSDQQVAYDTSCPTGQVSAAATFNALTNKEPSTPAGTGTSHSVVLSGLFASTNYYYMVRSADSIGNISYNPSSANTCNSFTTTAPLTRIMKTTEFYIEQASTTANSITKTFDVFISESKTDRSNINIKSIGLEVFGISKSSGNFTVSVTLNGVSKDYNIADTGGSSAYWSLNHMASGINFDCINCSDTSNTLQVSVSGATANSLLGAKAVITYYYSPL